MSTRQYLILSGCTLLAGILFYGIYNELIVFHLPSKRGTQPLEEQVTHKNIPLIFWKNGSFLTEEKELLIRPNRQRTLNDLLTSWLNLLEEEHILKKKVSIQSIMLDASGSEASISFDRNPLGKEDSTYQKLMTLEGLLTTIKSSGLPLTSVRFLVNYKTINDPHLDFSHPWPITGYSKQA